MTKTRARKLPPFPEAIEYVWEWFLDLSLTRSYSEAGAGPITWQEIGAYNQEALCGMRVWEKHLIRELDDIARTIWNKVKTGDKEPNLIPATDSAGLKAMFERLAAQQQKG